MKDLPKGYKRLEYLPISAPRMFYLTGFISKEIAEARISELRRYFPSPRYSYQQYIPVIGMMPIHMVCLPENAIRYLSLEERKRLVPIVHQPPQRIYLKNNIPSNLVLYRIMERKYIKCFLDTGKLMLTTFKRCNNLEDNNRRDQEGRFKITASHGKLRAEMEVGIGDNILMFCTSTTKEYTPPDGKKEEYALEIHNVRRFFELITQALVKQGCNVMYALNGCCEYIGRDIKENLQHSSLEKLLEESNNSNKFDFGLFDSIVTETINDESYFFKPNQNSYENEYRLLWFLDREVEAESYFVYLPEEARNLCCEVTL